MGGFPVTAVTLPHTWWRQIAHVDPLTVPDSEVQNLSNHSVALHPHAQTLGEDRLLALSSFSLRLPCRPRLLRVLHVSRGAPCSAPRSFPCQISLCLPLTGTLTMASRAPPGSPRVLSPSHGQAHRQSQAPGVRSPPPPALSLTFHTRSGSSRWWSWGSSPGSWSSGPPVGLHSPLAPRGSEVRSEGGTFVAPLGTTCSRGGKVLKLLALRWRVVVVHFRVACRPPADIGLTSFS